jgi:hypothetical protein
MEVVTEPRVTYTRYRLDVLDSDQIGDHDECLLPDILLTGHDRA